MPKKLIWVLKDNRPGNYVQAINLADILGFSYEIKEISYNVLAKLPNFLKYQKFSTIDEKSKHNLMQINQEKPDIIISAGRRSANVALDLKSLYPNMFLINIMNPGNGLLDKFDLVVVPKHDNIAGNNVISINGSIAKIDEEKVKENSREFKDIFAKIKSPKIGLLLGGSSKSANFTMDDARSLRKITDKVCKNMNAKMLVVTSRRTDSFLIDKLQNHNSNIAYFSEFGESANNPYLAILNDADYLIVTGDSISMCSEACGFGKPVFIYSSQNISSKKHIRFHEDLFVGNFAFKLEKNLVDLQVSSFKKLDEITTVASKIRNMLG